MIVDSEEKMKDVIKNKKELYVVMTLKEYEEERARQVHEAYMEGYKEGRVGFEEVLKSKRESKKK